MIMQGMGIKVAVSCKELQEFGISQVETNSERSKIVQVGCTIRIVQAETNRAEINRAECSSLRKAPTMSSLSG